MPLGSTDGQVLPGLSLLTLKRITVQPFLKMVKESLKAGLWRFRTELLVLSL